MIRCFMVIGTCLGMHFARTGSHYPRISAVQYLCAQAEIDMNDMWLTSSHGRAVASELAGEPSQSGDGHGMPAAGREKSRGSWSRAVSASLW